MQPHALLLLLLLLNVLVDAHPHMGHPGEGGVPDICKGLGIGSTKSTASWLSRLDTVTGQPPPSKVGFGSCSNPKFPQPLWKEVIAWGPPDVWLWSGDAVYPQRKPKLRHGLYSTVSNFWRDNHTHAHQAAIMQHNTTAALEEAFQLQLASSEYAAFKATGVSIEGVYDDHDYGTNDAGTHLATKTASQRLYLDFLNVAPDSPRRARDGLYSAHLYGQVSSGSESTATTEASRLNNNRNDDDDGGGGPNTNGEREQPQQQQQQLLVVFLDTRTHRADHAIPSIATKEWLPLSAPLAAVIRLASALFGYGRDHEGDMLGEAQWEWLNNVLKDSTADATLIVTSVQLLTSNPLVESWGHFPASKARLLKLLDATAPKGLLVLSGDVHFAEIAGRRSDVNNGDKSHDQADHAHSRNAKDSSSSASPSPIEVTSSGMTHSCSSPWFGFVCVPVLSTFNAHRWRGLDGYPHVNWGALDLDWETNIMHVQVKNADGQTVLEATKRIGVKEPLPLSSNPGSGSAGGGDGVVAVVADIPSVYSNVLISVPHHPFASQPPWVVYSTAFIGGVMATVLITCRLRK